MRVMNVPIFDVDCKTFTRNSINGNNGQISILRMSVQVAGIDVFVRYYTNSPGIENTKIDEVWITTTRSNVYDPEEASAFLLVEFGKFLQERWTQ